MTSTNAHPSVLLKSSNSQVFLEKVSRVHKISQGELIVQI